MGKRVTIYLRAEDVGLLEWARRHTGQDSVSEAAAAFGPEVIGLGEAGAVRAARLNAGLAARGLGIGDRALCHGLELLTLNAAEFGRVPGLRVVGP